MGCIHHFRKADTKMDVRGMDIIIVHDNGTTVTLHNDLVQEIFNRRLRQ